MKSTEERGTARIFFLAALYLLGCLAYTALALTPSSYGKALELLGLDPHQGLILGTARAIRSDEWMGMTPYFQIAVANQFGSINQLPPITKRFAPSRHFHCWTGDWYSNPISGVFSFSLQQTPTPCISSCWPMPSSLAGPSSCANSECPFLRHSSFLPHSTFRLTYRHGGQPTRGLLPWLPG